MRTILVGWMVLFVWHADAGAQPEDWLPDMTVDPAFLNDTIVVDDVVPGRIHLRLSNATPNVGLGRLYVYGVLPANSDGSQDVMQRVFRSDGSYFDRAAGRFVHHPEHEHIHVEDWALYRLRAILPGDDVGDIVATGEKTSYCLRDSKPYDSSLPNYVAGGFFGDCDGTVQGISVGYEDIYTKELPDQWIDVTDVPWGEYWLESVVDPENHILESDENNNVVRVKVVVGEPAGPFGYLREIFLAFIRQLLNMIRAILGLPPIEEGAGLFCDCS